MKLINKWNEKENTEMKNSMKIKEKLHMFLNQEHNKVLFSCFSTFYLFSFLRKSLTMFLRFA